MIEGCVKKTLPFVFSHFLIFKHFRLKFQLNIVLYMRKHYKEFHKGISIQSEEIQILLNVTEFPNLPASLMQCNVSNRPDGYLNNFNSFHNFSTKIKANLNNIMANHQLKFN